MCTIPIAIDCQGVLITGFANPLPNSESNLFPLKIYIKGWCLGVLNNENNKWIMDQPIDPKFIEALGKYIYVYYKEKRLNNI